MKYYILQHYYDYNYYLILNVLRMKLNQQMKENRKLTTKNTIQRFKQHKIN